MTLSYHVKNIEMSSLLLLGMTSAFVNVTLSKDTSSSSKAARVTKETSEKARANRKSGELEHCGRI